MAPRALAALEAAASTLGAEADPACWVQWGDDPGVRYLVLIPSADGLIQAHVRVNVPGEGRAHRRGHPLEPSPDR